MLLAQKLIDPILRARGEGVEYLSTCSANCGGTCLLHLQVRDGRVTDVRPDPRHTPCLKGLAQYEKINHPDRLLYPLRRVGPRGASEVCRPS